MTPDEERQDWKFEFVVQDISQAQALELMDNITEFIDGFTEGSVGGGYWLEMHNEIEEEADG